MEARIALKFDMKSYIYGKNNLSWRESSTSMVYVDLKVLRKYIKLLWMTINLSSCFDFL